MMLGGLIAQAAHGDYKPANPVIKENTVQQFLRSEHDMPQAREQSAEDLNIQHASHLGMPGMEAKTQVLRIYSKWKWAEASIFLVEQPKKQPSQFLLAIMPGCVMFLNESDMEPFDTHPFDMIATWGCTNTTFNIKIGSLMKPINLIFNTRRGGEISLILKSRMEEHRNRKTFGHINNQNSDAMLALGRTQSPPTSPTTSPTTTPTSTSFPASFFDKSPTTEKRPVVPSLHIARAMMLSVQ